MLWRTIELHPSFMHWTRSHQNKSKFFQIEMFEICRKILVTVGPLSHQNCKRLYHNTPGNSLWNFSVFPESVAKLLYKLFSYSFQESEWWNNELVMWAYSSTQRSPVLNGHMAFSNQWITQLHKTHIDLESYEWIVQNNLLAYFFFIHFGIRIAHSWIATSESRAPMPMIWDGIVVWGV